MHINDFQDIVNQLNNLEVPLIDNFGACILLGTLPDRQKKESTNALVIEKRNLKFLNMMISQEKCLNQDQE